jgi:peptide/nickel transport system permease protein
MSTFLIRRLFSMVFVWIGVTLLTFLIANVVPADPVAMRLGPKANPASIEKMRREMGLDRPLPEQYVRYLGGLLRGDLGTSIWSGRPITRDLGDYLPASLELATSALLLAIFIGIPLGLWAATHPNRFPDRLVQSLSAAGLAVPLFLFGMLLQLLFYRQLGWLPLDSRINLIYGPPHHITGLYILDSLLRLDFYRLGSSFLHLLLPTITLSLPATGAIARMMRASTIEVLGQEYVRAARARGIPHKLLLWRHVVTNALLPVVTLIGNTFNALLAGTFVVEVVFDWPGLGWYATKVIRALDYGSIVSITLVIAVLCTTINLIVDLLYRKLDPRIQMT